MRATFSGVLLPGNNHESKTPPTAQRWQCSVCYVWNEPASAEQTLESLLRQSLPHQQHHNACATCHRPQQPQWLHLDSHDFQIQLGSLLTIRRQDGSSNDGDNTLHVDVLRLAVVVAIDFAHKQIDVLVVTHTSERGRPPRLRFQELVLVYPLQFASLEPHSLSFYNHSDSIDSTDEWYRELSKHGICGACRRVFHVSQGDAHSKDANEIAIRALRDNISALQTQKQQWIHDRQFDRVVAATAEIRAIEQQVQRAQQQLEFLDPLFCPFCGWVERASDAKTADTATTK